MSSDFRLALALTRARKLLEMHWIPGFDVGGYARMIVEDIQAARQGDA